MIPKKLPIAELNIATAWKESMRYKAKQMKVGDWNIKQQNYQGRKTETSTYNLLLT